MYYLYVIESDLTEFVYFGITCNIRKRWAGHKHSARRGLKSPLYDCMRKYGLDNFQIVEVSRFLQKHEACDAEIGIISKHRASGSKILNVANGGEGGYVIPEPLKKDWIEKLKVARAGKKPALGMKHTEKNKRFFSECNKRKVPKYQSLNPAVVDFQTASREFGISKTHYYRLLKRAKRNELS